MHSDIGGVGRLVASLKAAGQDHEFYPTTDEILQAVVRDVRKHQGRYDHTADSLLDIGAGNGKVLLTLAEALKIEKLSAIEKSPLLIQQLPAQVRIVGTDFHEQSLFSQSSGLVFCNPPYSEYETWAEKILRQCSGLVYLVIPKRWERSGLLADALRFRSAEAHVVGEFDFEDAEDRRARAQVHLLSIDLRTSKHRHEAPEAEPFELFFKEQFADLIARYEATEPPKIKLDDRPLGGRRRPYHGLAVGPDYPDAMVALYSQEIAHIERNYHLISELDASLLREFEISPERIMSLLRARLSNLRMEYWKELFGKLHAITSRLTAQSRARLLDTLNEQVAVDFTVSNILAVVIWAIKNANQSIDRQLVSTYELMVDKCNVRLYKSNTRTWEAEGWRYNSEKNSHFALDYRIVSHRVGGICSDYGGRIKLEARGEEFLGDLLTIANNLGFRTADDERTKLRQDIHPWRAGQLHTLYYTDATTGRSEPLYDVRAFKNGNIHLRFNQRFILALNVEYGRLKGWLRSPEEAAEELENPEAASFYRSNLQLSPGSPALLIGSHEDHHSS